MEQQKKFRVLKIELQLRPHQRRQHAALRRLGVRGLLHARQQKVKALLQKHLQQDFFRLEIVVEGSLPDIRPIGNILDLRPINPLFIKQAERDVEEDLTGLVLPPLDTGGRVVYRYDQGY